MGNALGGDPVARRASLEADLAVVKARQFHTNEIWAQWTIHVKTQDPAQMNTATFCKLCDQVWDDHCLHAKLLRQLEALPPPADSAAQEPLLYSEAAVTEGSASLEEQPADQCCAQASAAGHAGNHMGQLGPSGGAYQRARRSVAA